MELDQIRNFMKVAEQGSFTKAAEEIPLSQPALSRSIQRLEEELGQPLFERQTRRVSLTDAGQILLTRAKQIVSAVDDLKSEICDERSTWICTSWGDSNDCSLLLATLPSKVQTEFSDANVIVLEDTTHELLRKVSDGVIDVAIAALPIDMKYLEIEELFHEELLVVMAKDHP